MDDDDQVASPVAGQFVAVTPESVDPVDAVANELATTVATYSVPQPQYVATPEPPLELATVIPAAIPRVTPPAAPPVPSPKEESPVATTPQRSKPIPKPDREVTRNLDGKLVCTYASCTDEPREFTRKCEWK